MIDEMKVILRSLYSMSQHVNSLGKRGAPWRVTLRVEVPVKSSYRKFSVSPFAQDAPAASIALRSPNALPTSLNTRCHAAFAIPESTESISVAFAAMGASSS